ncbi:MAG TPA: GNAT family N-acetyltransferase [Armatimonadota bacterium]|jgi:ribosomal protein S18 acetylase RimI-like enzyme|nr:GNAT family N-acetyltransferase [Armatimonadota bacterium]HOM82480.1 GNAT family N-acetyltransferase [Armatimonadota bacterium]HPO74112.1 GNAT family N-acetyltransferase [Armatimonadota bacterium]HPT98917.1 GNAT family N-acetyltransferase [Armatimonadota bacterium]
MERIPVIMIRADLEGLPSFPLPAGYRIRCYRQGEESHWAEVESAAGEFQSSERALARFLEEFGGALAEMEERCFFLETDAGRVIGTATAWYHPNFRGARYGRLHWVAVHPEFQGRKLAKPLVGAAMHRLAELHTRAYLTTQTTSWKAVKIYLDFGFVPLMETPRCEEAWRLLAEITGHPALTQFRGR